MQRFLVIFVVLCLVPEALGTISCYINNNGGTGDKCKYCLYKKEVTTINGNQMTSVVKSCESISDHPSIQYTNDSGNHTFTQINHCSNPITNNYNFKLYICDSDLCNDTCSATGYVLGFGLLIAIVAKFFA